MECVRGANMSKINTSAQNPVPDVAILLHPVFLTSQTRKFNMEILIRPFRKWIHLWRYSLPCDLTLRQLCAYTSAFNYQLEEMEDVKWGTLLQLIFVDQHSARVAGHFNHRTSVEGFRPRGVRCFPYIHLFRKYLGFYWSFSTRIDYFASTLSSLNSSFFTSSPSWIDILGLVYECRFWVRRSSGIVHPTFSSLVFIKIPA